MKKMKYEKPSMKVVVLSNQSHLLAGSEKANGGFGSYYYDEYTGYEIESEDLED